MPSLLSSLSPSYAFSRELSLSLAEPKIYVSGLLSSLLSSLLIALVSTFCSSLLRHAQHLNTLGSWQSQKSMSLAWSGVFKSPESIVWPCNRDPGHWHPRDQGYSKAAKTGVLGFSGGLLIQSIYLAYCQHNVVISSHTSPTFCQKAEFGLF